jgi:integrase
MASTYLRPDSPFIWIRYKKADGKWSNANTGLRKDDAKDRKHAKLFAKQKSLAEAVQRPIAGRSTFNEWVQPWLEQRWGKGNKHTLRKYRMWWREWSIYLSSVGATSPVAVNREIVLAYVQQREASGTSRNTALDEVSFLAVVLDEAFKRKYATENPARRLGLSRIEQVHKEIWTEEQIQLSLDAAEKADRFGFIHVALLMGKYQAARISSCAVPIAAIDFDRGEIRYPGNVIKGGKPFVQAIDPRFAPTLKQIVEHRRALGEIRLCDLPKDPSPSLDVRRFLDGIGLQGLSQHGLRSTWCTQAALRGIPMAVAMKYTNHASEDVHRAYEQISAGDVNQFFGLLK